jgi:hypothetical protein
MLTRPEKGIAHEGFRQRTLALSVGAAAWTHATSKEAPAPMPPAFQDIVKAEDAMRQAFVWAPSDLSSLAGLLQPWDTPDTFAYQAETGPEKAVPKIHCQFRTDPAARRGSPSLVDRDKFLENWSQFTKDVPFFSIALTQVNSHIGPFHRFSRGWSGEEFSRLVVLYWPAQLLVG